MHSVGKFLFYVLVLASIVALIMSAGEKNTGKSSAAPVLSVVTASPAAATAKPPITAAAPTPVPHFALQRRDYGPCGKLLGRTGIVLAFVSTPEHPWTDQKKNEVYNVSFSSVDIMESEAARYGAWLELSLGALEFSVPFEYDSDLEWYHYILREYYGTDTITDVISAYENTPGGSDDVMVIFLFNSWDRSYAYVSRITSPQWQEEFCVIFCDTDMHDNYLTHEVLHLYGAIDLYDYNNEGIAAAAERYFPSSCMLGTSYEVDSLTAYLIGWTDTLSPEAQAFLRETEGLR